MDYQTKLMEYIQNNKLCTDNIFANWKEFLDLLYAQGGCVESILWYEYVPVDQQAESMGGGGYLDKTNPDYMYAETHIYEKGLACKSRLEVEAYIESVIASYPQNHLMPAFFTLK